MRARLPCLGLFILMLSGCVAAPTFTGSHQSELPPREIGTLIFDAAVKCWSREPNIFLDGVIVENKVELRGIVITARKVGLNLPYIEPYMYVYVDYKNGRTVITTEEGEFAMAQNYSHSADVERWIRGDLTCKS